MSHEPNDLISRIAQALSDIFPGFGIAANLKSRTPSGLLVYPGELVEGLPHRGERFYKGEFALNSGVAKSGASSPFDIVAPHQLWQDELLSFSWLRDLKALEQQNKASVKSSKGVGLSTIHGRSLISEWINNQGKDASSPEIKARRIISWLYNAAFLLKNDDGIFQELFLASLDQQVRALAKITPGRIRQDQRLTCLTALCFACICLEGAERSVNKKISAFTAQINLEILPDGGHISRNPTKLIVLLQDFIPLLKAYELRNKTAPKELVNAIDRMFPMLRFFILGDGSLAQFNGASDISPATINTLLKIDTQSGKPLSHARHSQYHRIQNGQTILIFDSGGTPPRHFSSDHHASALAFEMSHQKCRLIVNCGNARPQDEYWRDAATATAAHSTLILDDTSQAAMIDGSKLKLKKKNNQSTQDFSESEHTQNAKGNLIEAAHTGYVDKFGIVHQRRLYLSSNGMDLRGEDTLLVTTMQKTKARNFAIRFHLHPDVKLTKPKKGDQLHLLLPNKAAWSFSCSGAKISHEDSIYLGDDGAPKKCRQIVLHGPVRDQKTVKWALKAASAPKRQRRKKTEKKEPNLPFDDAPQG